MEQPALLLIILLSLKKVEVGFIPVQGQFEYPQQLIDGLFRPYKAIRLYSYSIIAFSKNLCSKQLKAKAHNQEYWNIFQYKAYYFIIARCTS